MQISKFMLVVCAATGAASLSVPAVDTPAQAKARAALEQRMKELEGQPPAATPAPVQPTVAAVAQPPVQIQAADSEAIARARAAMRQRLSELQAGAQTPKAVAAAPATPTPAPTASSAASLPGETVLAPTADSEAIVRARQAMRARIAGTPTTAPTAPAIEPAFDPNLASNPNANPAAQAKAQAALRQRLEQLGAQPAPTLQPVQVFRVKSGQEMALKNAPGFKPITGPELPPTVTLEKQQRLLDLLNRYKADQVTPEEYHTERAKILSAH